MNVFERICFFACVVLIMGLYAVSLTLAGKPPKPVYVEEYGFARLYNDDNGSSTAIQNDGNSDYSDCTKGGKDYVYVKYNKDTGEFVVIDVVIGRMQYFHPGCPLSDRRVNLCFDVRGTKIAENYVGNEAVYDILERYNGPNGHLRSSGPAGYIDDGSVITEIYADTTHGIVHFLVDPGSDCTDEKAIDDEAVNAFYSWDTPKLNYKDTTEYGESGQIFYSLDYNSGFNVIRNDRTWTITPKEGQVRLYVRKYTGTRNTGAVKVIYLATYESVPSFKLVVSLDSPPPLAPGKYTNATTTWSNIKGK